MNMFTNERGRRIKSKIINIPLFWTFFQSEKNAQNVEIFSCLLAVFSLQFNTITSLLKVLKTLEGFFSF